MDDLTSLKSQLAIPGDLQSCHTATVSDYVIEGHVPAEQILRLMSQRPAANGLAVADMPAGSPGMETTGQSEPFEVVLFGSGKREVYARY